MDKEVLLLLPYEEGVLIGISVSGKMESVIESLRIAKIGERCFMSIHWKHWMKDSSEKKSEIRNNFIKKIKISENYCKI